ncbi:hypothetical protein C7974DRAFT_162124 [Boeremia exigua]|uniref:uncharacterized protein n=1 Tax=Boeremia exigua TaxID=749465 RepID=UPI001E8D89BB|nr:uncharacterized protein C7974DRAFT_162124 [Boeremia exigua]KAH6632909.1 hypothetical protein C7974DRAFT_162124 [Boeremia exigua]
MRKTQRAPRSCIPCTSRKIKCDKLIPCRTCIRRGRQEDCVRETVLVRGEIIAYRDGLQQPTYEDLKRENEHLRGELATLQAHQANIRSRLLSAPETGEKDIESWEYQQWKTSFDDDQDGLDRKLWDTLASEPQAIDSQVMTWNDIVLPVKSCHDQLIDYDEKWNSWIHYALEYPRFRNECDDFTAAMVSGASLAQLDPLWLAVYFSVLSVSLLMTDDKTAAGLAVNESISHHTLSRNWYNAAVFCLRQAEFMQTPGIRSVQAIAVLGICCNNFGESDFGGHLWSCAILNAKTIGLDAPVSKVATEQLSEEAQHRLWWTLVICEWLRHPYRPPAINDFDFDIPYPQPPILSPSTDSNKTREHPVHYHIFMARASKVYHRFCRAVRLGVTSLESMIRAVRLADEELAGIIVTLPNHLQPDAELAGRKDASHETDLSESWIKWQRFDLTLVLLHLRIRINRTLQVQWLSTPGVINTDWARTVTVRSATSIIWIHKNWDQPSSMRKQWYVCPQRVGAISMLSFHILNDCRALSYHIFTAAIVLLREWQDDDPNFQSEHREGLYAALDLMKQVESRNALARHAFTVLRERMDEIGFS